MRSFVWALAVAACHSEPDPGPLVVLADGGQAISLVRIAVTPNGTIFGVSPPDLLRLDNGRWVTVTVPDGEPFDLGNLRDGRVLMITQRRRSGSPIDAALLEVTEDGVIELLPPTQPSFMYAPTGFPSGHVYVQGSFMWVPGSTTWDRAPLHRAMRHTPAGVWRRS